MDSLVKHFDNNPKQFLGPLGQSQRKIERARKKKESHRNSAVQKK
jgi:phospholipid/cholesterol/gamma-HCH transport system substrate-binding protein